MLFKDNFNETLLIAEKPVLFYNDDPYCIVNVSFFMNLLTLADVMTNPYVQIILTLFNLSMEDLHKAVPGVQFENLLELLTWLLQQGSKDQFSKAFQIVCKYILGDRFNIYNNEYAIDDISIELPLFQRIQNICLITAGIKNFNDLLNQQKPKWMVEQEERIRRIKNQNKTNDSESFSQLMKILLPLNYELHYTFEELFAMNYYHIKFLSKYIPKIINYDMQKRQIMSKKPIKYITET